MEEEQYYNQNALQNNTQVKEATYYQAAFGLSDSEN
jgi:hypothetical protein